MLLFLRFVGRFYGVLSLVDRGGTAASRIGFECWKSLCFFGKQRSVIREK